MIMQLIENIVIALAVIIVIVYCMYLCFNKYLVMLGQCLLGNETESDQC